MSVFVARSPLEIPLILELVSSYLPVKDLISCVKVCELWNTEMMRALKKRRMRTIHIPQNENMFKKIVDKFNREKIELAVLYIKGHLPRDDIYLSRILSRWGVLLHKLDIRAFHSEWTAPIFYALLKDFSPNLRIIMFDIVKRSVGNNEAAVPVVERSSLSLLSELRRIDTEFKYPNLADLAWNEGKHVQVELTDLCYLFPSLQRLDVKTRGRERPIALYELKSSKKLYWQSLFMLSYHTYELCCTPLMVLLHLKPNIDHFSFRFNTVTRQYSQKREISNTFSKLLSAMNSSLESLRIEQRPADGQGFINCSECMDFDLDLPNLTNLVSLYIFPSKMSAKELLDFPSGLPCEKLLLPEVICFEGSFTDLHSSYHFPNLQRVNLIFPSRRFLSEIENFGCYPNVIILEVHPKNVDDNLFHTLNDMFPNLKSLDIDPEMFFYGNWFTSFNFAPKIGVSRKWLLTDTAITGISQNDFNDLWLANPGATEISKELWSPIRKFSSLASFKNLLTAYIDLNYTAASHFAGLCGPWVSYFKEDSILIIDFPSRPGYKKFRKEYG